MRLAVSGAAAGPDLGCNGGTYDVAGDRPGPRGSVAGAAGRAGGQECCGALEQGRRLTLQDLRQAGSERATALLWEPAPGLHGYFLAVPAATPHGQSAAPEWAGVDRLRGGPAKPKSYDAPGWLQSAWTGALNRAALRAGRTHVGPRAKPQRGSGRTNGCSRPRSCSAGGHVRGHVPGESGSPTASHAGSASPRPHGAKQSTDPTYLAPGRSAHGATQPAAEQGTRSWFRNADGWRVEAAQTRGMTPAMVKQRRGAGGGARCRVLGCGCCWPPAATDGARCSELVASMPGRRVRDQLREWPLRDPAPARNGHL